MQSSRLAALSFCLAASAAGQSPDPAALRVSLFTPSRSIVSPEDHIEIRLSRPLASGERIALIAGDTDVSALLEQAPQKVSLTPASVLLPPGEAQIRAYVVTAQNEWRDAGTVRVKVGKAKAGAAAESQGQQLPRPFTWQQSTSLQFRSQPFYKTTAKLSYRRTFEELTLQSNMIGRLQGQGWNAELQTNVAGSSQEQNAPRYAELGRSAPPVDLASYSLAIETKRVKAWVGDQSFGASRHLLNGFTARGLRMATNFGGRFDVTVGLMSGGVVQGYQNLLGIEDGDNRILAATFGVELRKSAPGAARVELTGLRGTAKSVYDGAEEESSGMGARFAGQLWQQRLVWDAGMAHSVASEGGRGADYVDLSVQMLRNVKLTKRIQTSWTATFHEERVDPGYQSVGAFVQPDRSQNQIEVAGAVGALQFTLDYGRISELLSTAHTRQASFLADLPLREFLGVKKDRKKWLPRVTYSYFGLRNSSADSGERTLAHSVAVDWGKRMRFGYRFGFDGQADYRHTMHAATFGWSLAKKLDVSGEAGVEESAQIEARTWAARLSERVKWKPNSRLVLSMNCSGTRLRDSSGGEALQGSLDAQAQWKVLAENLEKGRRVRTEWYARYSNRYQFAESGGSRSFYRTQYFQAGLTFTFL